MDEIFFRPLNYEADEVLILFLTNADILVCLRIY